MIEELIIRAADKAGLSEGQTRTALSGALALIRKHGDAGRVGELMGAVPGSAELADEGEALTAKGGGFMGGLMKAAGGSGGAAMSDAMAMAPRLAREGVTTSDMQSILPVAMHFIQEKTGQDLLRQVLVTVPGLGPLLTGQKG